VATRALTLTLALALVLALGFESAISIRPGAKLAVQEREKRMEGKGRGMIGEDR
jgi:hypothetical protein